MDQSFSLTIDAAAQPTVGTIEVVDPSTGAPFALAPNAAREQVHDAVEAAHRAFARWSADSDARAECLQEAARRISADADMLARLTTLEQGKPFSAALGEVAATAQFFSEFASVRPARELERDDGTNVAIVERRPLGVIAAITPWNSALYVTGMKIAPALAAGNTVVVKPAPETPLASLRLGEILREVFPPGVVNVVSGSGQVGPWLTAEVQVRLISFTGSIPTGKQIAAAAAHDLKRCVLELGGNDAAIVLDDADLSESLIDTLFWNSFGNAGQVCSGIKRVYAHRSIRDDLADAFAARAHAVRVGPGMSPDTQIGPLTTDAQRAIVATMVDAASQSGCRVLAGGHALDRPGYFYAPTVVSCDIDEVTLVLDEQFGPALPILEFDSDVEVVERANRGEYGLGGSVWTSDFERGARLAGQLDTGMGWVNTHKGIDSSLPFGGAKSSGIGVERGRWGMDCLTELHSISGVRQPSVSNAAPAPA